MTTSLGMRAYTLNLFKEPSKELMKKQSLSEAQKKIEYKPSTEDKEFRNIIINL